MKILLKKISSGVLKNNLHSILIVFFMSLTLLILFCIEAPAEYYKWTDEKGQLHITDDRSLVPEAYLDKFEVVSPKPALSIPASEIPKTKTKKQPSKVKAQLYGDYPLNWWKNRFDLKRMQIEEVSKEIEQKQIFLDLYSGGRRHGKVYSKEQQKMNKKYKEEIPELEEKKELYEEELAEIIRKATYNGVPRSVRGD